MRAISLMAADSDCLSLGCFYHLQIKGREGYTRGQKNIYRLFKKSLWFLDEG